MARAAIMEFNAGPKCGAVRKFDGQPCQQPGLENGRCRFHGGLVPRGDKWHKHRWPETDGPAVEKRFHDKQKQIDRQAKARAKRLAAMSPEERERYRQWQRTHKAGSAAARQTKRAERESALHIQDLMATPAHRFPEFDELQEKIDLLKQERALRTLFD
jgi:hypothetical protein